MVKQFRKRWPEATVHCGGMKGLRYRSSLQLIGQLPKLFLFGLRAALKAFGSGEPPVVFLVSTDLEVLGVALAKLMRRQRTPVVMFGFIYTQRSLRAVNWLRRNYFRFVLGLTTGVICHSRLERDSYTRTFRLESTRFEAVPYALHVAVPSSLRVHEGGYVLSAGRGERDYGLLAEAWVGMNTELRIVCDVEAPLRPVKPSPRIKLLRQCFGGDYLRELAGADFVVVPIRDCQVSAGQMVLLQAMSLGKAVIISRTPTTEEYGEHLKTVYFVEHGSAEALRQAILHLRSDAGLRRAIGAAAAAHYRARHTSAAYANDLLSAVERLLPAA
jgi:glycosyltransferase involved in cell wall biosynthesis